jgi:hypothetical protein
MDILQTLRSLREPIFHSAIFDWTIAYVFLLFLYKKLVNNKLSLYDYTIIFISIIPISIIFHKIFGIKTKLSVLV